MWASFSRTTGRPMAFSTTSPRRRSGEVHEARGQDRRRVTVEAPGDADADRFDVVVQQLPA